MTRRCLRVSKLSYVEQLPANYCGVFMPAIEVFIAARRSCCTTTSSGEAWRGEAVIPFCLLAAKGVPISFLQTWPAAPPADDRSRVEWMLCTAVAWLLLCRCGGRVSSGVWPLFNVSRARLRCPIYLLSRLQICRRMHPSPFQPTPVSVCNALWKPWLQKMWYVRMYVCQSICLSLCMYVCM